MKHCLGARHSRLCCLWCGGLCGLRLRVGDPQEANASCCRPTQKVGGINHFRKKCWQKLGRFSDSELSGVQRGRCVCVCVICLSVLLTLLVPWAASAMPLESLEIPILKSKAP